MQISDSIGIRCCTQQQRTFMSTLLSLNQCCTNTEETDAADAVLIQAVETFQMFLSTVISETAVELEVSTKHRHCSL